MTQNSFSIPAEFHYNGRMEWHPLPNCLHSISALTPAAPFPVPVRKPPSPRTNRLRTAFPYENQPLLVPTASELPLRTKTEIPTHTKTSDFFNKICTSLKEYVSLR